MCSGKYTKKAVFTKVERELKTARKSYLQKQQHLYQGDIDLRLMQWKSLMQIIRTTS
jgi:hypothetical protein